MRLWSLHPRYLDTKGLSALWREALLAQKVLSGRTSGYKNHPQLERFKEHPRPGEAIAAYLLPVWEESKRRDYHFDLEKISVKKTRRKIQLTQGQLKYEFKWLCQKLRNRSPQQYRFVASQKKVWPHPFFQLVKGPAEPWEHSFCWPSHGNPDFILKPRATTPNKRSRTSKPFSRPPKKSNARH